MRRLLLALAALLVATTARATDPSPWAFGTAVKLPSEYTNQESGYFSIVEGLNGRLYVGAAKYGVNAFLLEYDPKSNKTAMVVDAMNLIGSKATGMAAQAKFHTRNNVGASGKIWCGTKQGYPEKGETADLYPGGYVVAYDPATGKAEHFGIPKEKHGVISVTPDEARGLVYISTCSDTRPIDHTHFMVLDLKTRKYRDLGDMESAYAFIVLDDRGRAYHPKRGGKVARFDPEVGKLELLEATVDGRPLPEALSRDGCIVNWEVSPDRKTLYSAELSTNQLYSFDLSAAGTTLPGKSLGKLLPAARSTDCRALAVAVDGCVWMTVSEPTPDGQLSHLVRYLPGTDAAPLDLGGLAVKNPDYTTLTDPEGKPKPWHHTLRTAKDGTWTPWQPLGIAPTRDGGVAVLTIAPFTLLRYSADDLKARVAAIAKRP
jgi:sugar lactone lactonase YvrE